jgi:hypothetical protein
LIYFADKAILAAAATKDVVRGADTPQLAALLLLKAFLLTFMIQLIAMFHLYQNIGNRGMG